MLSECNLNARRFVVYRSERKGRQKEPEARFRFGVAAGVLLNKQRMAD
jgi:hypothetical protein